MKLYDVSIIVIMVFVSIIVCSTAFNYYFHDEECEKPIVDEKKEKKNSYEEEWDFYSNPHSLKYTVTKNYFF